MTTLLKKRIQLQLLPNSVKEILQHSSAWFVSTASATSRHPALPSITAPQGLGPPAQQSQSGRRGEGTRREKAVCVSGRWSGRLDLSPVDCLSTLFWWRGSQSCGLFVRKNVQKMCSYPNLLGEMNWSDVFWAIELNAFRTAWFYCVICLHIVLKTGSWIEKTVGHLHISFSRTTEAFIFKSVEE